MKFPWLSSVGVTIIVIVLGIVAAPSPAMAQRPLGIDVSSYQGGSINWSSVKGSGITFAWAKAAEGKPGEGIADPDADFAINEANAKSAGVLIGAYYFAHPELDVGAAGADAEAAYFWSVAGNYIKTNGYAYVMPMLDFEQDVTSASPAYTKATLSAWVNEWCQDIVNDAAGSGVVVTPVVYTYISYAAGTSGHGPGLDSTVTQWPLWMANPGGNPQTGNPSSTTPWSTWALWQYGQATIPGITTGVVDEDVFDGTATGLTNSMVIGKATTPPPSGVTNYWDPGTRNASPGSGGTGTWDNSTSNWWLSGTGDIVWSTAGDYAIFAGTAGTVTLGSSVAADGLTFSTPGYDIVGSANLTLNGTTPVISVTNGSPTYIGCVLGGSGYEVTGGGILVLQNAANFSGSGTSAEYVNGPATTLVVLSDHDVGNGGVTLNLENGGIYQDNDSTSGDSFLLPGSAIALLSGGGVFDNPNANLTMSNFITGPGSLTTIGTTFTLTLTDTGNNYSGGTIVQSGTVKANAAGTLGSTSGHLTVSGGTLNLNGASHTVGAVTISGGTIQNGTLTGSWYAGQSGTVSAVLAGSGAMTQTTSGTLILTGVNTYSGGTTIGGGGVFYSILADSALGAAASPLTLNGGCLKNDNSAPTLNASRTITLGVNGGYFDAGWAPTNPITINGKLTGTGPLLINLDGSPVILANTGNNYAGDTIIGTNGPGYYAPGSQAWLKLGASGVIPNGSGHGNVVINQAYLGLLDLAGSSQTINGLSGNGTVNNSAGNGSLSVGNNNATSTFGGLIENTGGTLALTKTGTGTLTLTGTNTYSGNTTISGGTLALGSTGFINNTPTLTLNDTAIFDVSAIDSFTLSGNTTLSASAASVAVATIKGGTTVNLGSQPIILGFQNPGPSLGISQGTLMLNGNAFTVNGPLLAGGNVYTLIQQTSGNIAGSGPFSVTGTAIGAAGTTAAISISGAKVLLTITDTTTTTFNALSTSTYGQSITFTATVAPTPAGGTVQFYDNGMALGGPSTVSNGMASYSTSALSAGSHPITASYSGTTGYAASSTTGSSTQQVNTAALAITATAQTKTYGTLLTFGAGSTNFTGSGLQNSETVGTVTLAVSGNGDATNAPVGTYTITPSAATGGTFNPANYNITYNTGTLTVTPLPNTPVTITGITLLGDGTVQLNFAGTAGSVYLIEAATTLTPPPDWTALSTNTADTNGVFDFIDSSATNYSYRYYRTATQ